MSDAIRADSKGARLSGVTTATTEVLDLTAYVGRWVRIWGDQVFYWLAAPTASTTTHAFNVAASDLPTGTEGIPFECGADPFGQQYLVTADTPFLHVRGKSFTVQVSVKPTSDFQQST